MHTTAPGVSKVPEDVQHNIGYKDSDNKAFSITNKQWIYETTFHAHFVRCTTQRSNDLRALLELWARIWNRLFLQHQTQALEQVPLVIAYSAEIIDLFRNISIVSYHTLPPAPNIFSSHVIYKVNMNDENSLIF